MTLSRLLFCFGLLLGLGLSSSVTAQAQQEVAVVKLPAVRQLLARPSDTTYVVNFWATWCKPCVEELPNFEQVRAHHVTDKVRVVLISLDFKSKLAARVQPFVRQRNLLSTVWLLDETDANVYIDQIDPSWGGALPFTLVVNNAHNHRQVFERALSEAELEAAVLAAMR